MDRPALTDAQWRRMAPFCIGKAGDPGRSGADNRLFVEAVLWIARTGAPWSALPIQFGRPKSAYVRFRYWMRADVFQRMFDAVADDPGMQYAMVDGAIVKVGGQSGPDQRGLIARPPSALRKLLPRHAPRAR